MYGLSDQKSTPVCCGELRTDLGSSDTNLVPRSRSSRMGRAVGRYGGTALSSCSCWVRFAESVFPSPTAIPPDRPPARFTRTSPIRTVRTLGTLIGGPARRRSRGRTRAGTSGARLKGGASTRYWLRYLFGYVANMLPVRRTGKCADARSVTSRWRYVPAPWRD